MRRRDAYDTRVKKALYGGEFLRAIACGVLLCAAGCTSSKPETSRAYSNALSPKNVKRIDAQEAPFIASKSGLVYHTRYCRYAAAIKDPAGYSSARDAAIKGLIPCEFCNPQSHVVATPPVKTDQKTENREKPLKTEKNDKSEKTENASARDEKVTGP
jgi:hypothetical protein